MTPDYSKNDRERMEAKLTALLLGELPAHEEAALHRAMDEDPELAALYERLKATIELIKEGSRVEGRGEESAERGVQSASAFAGLRRDKELKLPTEKREKLLAHFKTIRPKEFVEAPKRTMGWLVPLAATVAIVAILAAMLLPALSKAKTKSMRAAVEYNLRLIDGAKQTWALEANASENVTPRPSDVVAYLGRGPILTNGLSSLAVAGETYVPGKVGDQPRVETTVSQARRWMGGQRIPEDRIHDGRVQLWLGEIEERKLAPEVAMTALPTPPIQNITKSGPSEQIVGQDASVSKEAIRAKGEQEGRAAAQLSTLAEANQRATFGLNAQSAPTAAPANSEIFLPSSNEAAGNEQIAMNNSGPGGIKPDVGNSGTLSWDQNIAVTNGLAGQPGWIGVLETPEQSRSAENKALVRYAYVASGVTNYAAFGSDFFDIKSAGAGGISNLLAEAGSSNDRYNPQTSYRMLSQLDSGAGQSNLNINYSNLVAGTKAESKTPNLGDIPPMGRIFEGESVETNGQFYTGLSHDDVSGLRYLDTNGVVASQPIDGNGGTVLTWKTFDGSTNRVTTASGGSVPKDGDLGLAGTRGFPSAATNMVQILTIDGATLADNSQTAKDTERTRGTVAWTTDTHNKVGNITLADRSAQQMTISDARNQFQSSTNTLNNNFGSVEPQATPSALQPTPKTEIVLPSEGNPAGNANVMVDPDTHNLVIIADSGEANGGIALPHSVGGGANQSFSDRVRALKRQASSGGKQVEMAAAANPQTIRGRRFQMTPIENKGVSVPPQATSGTEAAGVPAIPSQAAPLTPEPEITAMAHEETNAAALGVPLLPLASHTNYVASALGYHDDNANNPPESRSTATSAPPAQIALNDQKRVELASAEQELEKDKHWRDLLNMKINAEGVDKELPKARMVTIIDPATAATTEKVGLGEKLHETFSGKVERTASISVESEHTDISGLAGAPTEGYDPYFLQTEFNVIQSDAVLKKAAEKLNADKNGSGAQVTVAQLKKDLHLRPVKNSKEIEISARSETAAQAARIANAVVEAYRQYRLDEYEEIKDRGIKSLQDQLTEQDKKVELAQAKVDELAKESHAAATASSQANQSDNALPKPALAPPTPQPEILASSNAFSTFSMNVSDVSFKLAAASLEKGQMPEPASIRSEEFINAFDYRDPEAAPGVPVAFNYERALYPFAHNRELLRFSLKTAAAGRQAGRPLNVVLLLDNSGSMERADRVGIIQEALRVLAGQLQAQDTFSIVTFARTARLRVDGIPGNQAAAAVDEVGKFTPEGGTDLGDALDVAYETALHHYLANGDNRVVLLTDGAANLGDVDSNSLKQKVEAHRKQGVALDCFGIGWEGYNDDLLEVLTRGGDGRYGFINTPEEANTEFVSQIAGALHVAAADVKVQVEFNPDRVISYRQVGYAKHQLTKEQFRDNTVAAGQIAAQEAGNALYTIEVNPQGQGSIGTVRVRYKVSDTGEVREQSWDVPYTGSAVPLEQSSPAMRLAATASAFSEWLATNPFAEEVTTDQLLNYLNGVPQVYGADTRPQKLEWMIRQAKSISGK